MPKKDTFYKLLSETDDHKLCSIMAHQHGPYAQNYSLHNWVDPKFEGSKLFVFEKFDQAVKFMNMCCMGDWTYLRPAWIFSCEISNAVRLYNASPEGDHYQDFWKFYSTTDYGVINVSVSVAPTPEGTYITDRLRLLEPLIYVAKGYTRLHSPTFEDIQRVSMHAYKAP